MTEHDVVIAGGGPTGLMLAGELALAGVDVVVVERRPTQDLDGSRAGGLLARTLEVLDQRGIVDRFLDAGQTYPSHGFAMIPLDISDLPSRHNVTLGLPQRRFEPILAAWVEDELGAQILRDRDVTGLAQDPDGVDVELADGGSIRGRYVVGCDGGRSTIRRAAGIDSIGSDPTTHWLIAEFEADEEPELGMRLDERGAHGITRMAEGEPLRALVVEREAPPAGEPTLEDLREALVSVWGRDFGLREASWVSRFDDRTRQAVSYRDGRVLLAGDAAHIHPPMGGQGMNLGLQDAVNLGWKLAQAVAGVSSDALLDTYHQERHPVGARVLHNTLAQAALNRRDDRSLALRETMAELLAMDEPRQHIAAMLLALDIRYELGDGHPLVGRRVPDVDLLTATGPTRVYELLHEARPVLLDLRGTGAADAEPWAGRVQVVEASAEGEWELPLVGAVSAPSGVLIRPDGHVAWVGEVDDPSLPTAIATWFGS